MWNCGDDGFLVVCRNCGDEGFLVSLRIAETKVSSLVVELRKQGFHVARIVEFAAAASIVLFWCALTKESRAQFAKAVNAFRSGAHARFAILAKV